MAAPRRRLLKRVLVVGAVLGVVGAIAFFALAPGVVENTQNRMADAPLEPVEPQSQQLHDSMFVVDMHSDTLMWKRDLLDRSDRGHVDLPRLQEGNVGLQVFASVSKTPRNLDYEGTSGDSDNLTLLAMGQLQPPRTWFSLLERTLWHGKRLQDAADGSDGRLRTVRTRGDLEALVSDRAAGRDVTGALLAVEGLHNLEGDEDNVDRLVDAGVRMVGLAHFFDNEVAGSAHGEERGGLTDLGREVVEDFQRRDVVLDLAHVSPTAFDEVIGLAEAPLVVSHTGVHGTCEGSRNLSDDQIRAVAGTGGVVGIGYWAGAVCDLSPAAVVDAIEHVIDVGGLETAALGSDFDGATEMAWDTADLALITDELRARGHDDDAIAAIMGGNTTRVLLDVLPE